jgi:hypothetical protein
MSKPITCEQQLQSAGFRYNEKRDMWSNVKAGRALSGETVKRNTEQWIATWIAAVPNRPPESN